MTESLLRSASFGKSAAVYGHIDENGTFVRKRPARKMAITDKIVKNGRLSVKCVLLTDRSAKNGALSVNLSEILDRLVEQYCRLKKVVFIHCKLKMPDKISRKRTDFVRHFT